MRMTELKGRVVVDPTTARKRGVVVDVLVDATTARLAAVDISLSEADGAERIPAEWIARIGRDAVMLARTSVSPEDGSQAGPAEECLDYGSLVGLEVLDEGGDRVGFLQDAQVDPDSLSVTAYELTGAAWRRWFRWNSEIGSDEVTSWSRELMLVRARRATEQVAPGVLRQPAAAELPAADAPTTELIEPRGVDATRAAEREAPEAARAEGRQRAAPEGPVAGDGRAVAPEGGTAEQSNPPVADAAESLQRRAGRR